MKHSSYIKLNWFVMLLLAFCMGCQQTGKDSSSVPASSSDGIVRSHQKLEQIELTVEISPAKLRLSDDLQLTLIVRKQTDVKIELPLWDESLADFTIRDVQNPLPKLDGEFETIKQQFRLEPTRIGKQSIIPPAVIYYLDDSAKGGQASTDSALIIEVDPLEIEVTTELAAQVPSLDQLRPENQPVDLPPQNRTWLLWTLLAAVAVSLVALFAALYAKKGARNVPQLSPRELARIELKQLIEANWSKTDPKRYFVELTGIVRRFIERTTGVRAPEQTTEEFLNTIAGDRLFADEVQLRLREFLLSADLVKFAGLKPSDQDIGRSLSSAERFIESDIRESPASEQEQISK